MSLSIFFSNANKVILFWTCEVLIEYMFKSSCVESRLASHICVVASKNGIPNLCPNIPRDSWGSLPGNSLSRTRHDVSMLFWLISMLLYCANGLGSDRLSDPASLSMWSASTGRLRMVSSLELTWSSTMQDSIVGWISDSNGWNRSPWLLIWCDAS